MIAASVQLLFASVLFPAFSCLLLLSVRPPVSSFPFSSCSVCFLDAFVSAWESLEVPHPLKHNREMINKTITVIFFTLSPPNAIFY